jgi:hypothetical protein
VRLTVSEKICRRITTKRWDRFQKKFKYVKAMRLEGLKRIRKVEERGKGIEEEGKKQGEENLKEGDKEENEKKKDMGRRRRWRRKNKKIIRQREA